MIDSGFIRRDVKNIEEVFNNISIANGNNERTISRTKKSEIMKAMQQLGAIESAADSLFRIDKNQNMEIDFEEFIAAVQTPWPLEPWARSLPLSELLVDCLPPRMRNPSLRQIDHFSDEEIKEVLVGFGLGLERLLKMHNKELESRKCSAGTEGDLYTPGSKFNFDVPEDSQGNIEDFHKGLVTRIGEDV